MWTWSLNWGEITPYLVIGSCPMAPDDVEVIHAETGVSAFLSLQHDECLAYWGIDYEQMCRTGQELGLAMARSPMRDFDIADQRRCLPDAVAALARLQDEGYWTYVHCTAGLGRAPLTVLAHLILIEGQASEEAIRLILDGRPGAVPAWEAYRGCREDLVTRYRKDIERRAYELHLGGANDDPRADWDQAEALRSVLENRGPDLTRRPP